MTFSILVLDIALLLTTFILKVVRQKKSIRQQAKIQILKQTLFEGKINKKNFKIKQLLELYQQLSDSVKLPKELNDICLNLLLDSPLLKRLLRRLQSPFRLARIEAAGKLRYLESKPVQEALLKALKAEKDLVVAMYIGQALSIQKDKKAILPLFSKLRKSTPWMAKIYRAILYTYGKALLPYLQTRLDNSRKYMQLLICGFAVQYPSETLKEYLVFQAQSNSLAVRKQALLALQLHFPELLLEETFTASNKRDTIIAVINAYVQIQDKKALPKLIALSGKKSVQQHLVQGLSEMSNKDPSILNELLALFIKTRSATQKELLAKVLDNKIEYLLATLSHARKNIITELIQELVRVNHTSGLLFFLNQNKDKELENQIVQILRPLIPRSPILKNNMQEYLDERLQKVFPLPKTRSKKIQIQPHGDKPQRLKLLLVLFFVLAVFPLIILITEFPNVITLAFPEIGYLYVVRFNYLLVYYSVTINLIYLFVLVVSLRGSHVQKRLWESKNRHMLFTKELLPSVSIIAPAYNEANNIIESTNSLLNQHYPDFELVVVNDGSKDATLQSLISYYNLEKQDILIPNRLKTRTCKGVYTSKSIPNLIVIDKINGGKADSLNLGLNAATKEFFCGIDADSLLESEALLKAVSVMLDYQTESIATGGNICPVNGCSVELGSLDEITLPNKFLPRLQSLEYLRSFMSGRVGWAHMNLLLIISGAFGIFQREQTIRTGGYLTKKGKYKKDTVGEDMELVVRLSRFMKEQNKPYRVQYAFNANCWTEVPETWKVLHRQRDRWHRGLIDILFFHSTMIGNPRYGRLGMIGMPYYFVFEFIGPFIETQGLLMVIVAAIIGALNLQMALLLFTTTILLGILVSVSSVFISEFDREMYTSKDVAKLLGMAVVENFGIRQIISLWRVTSFFSAMRKNRGWGAQVRKGFKTQSVTTVQKKKQ